MNSAAKDMVTILAGISGLSLTAGTNLFYSRMPDSPQKVVTVYDTGGTPMTFLNDNTDIYHFSGVNIQVRDVTYDGAYDLAMQILEALHGKTGDVVGTTLYTLIKAADEPTLLHYDENDRPVISTNYDVQRRNT